MIPLPKSINTEKLEFYKLCWIIIYVSAAIDYLVNIDSENEWFRNFRVKNLRELKMMLLKIMLKTYYHQCHLYETYVLNYLLN
jgi:hypothetical protein